MLTHWTRNAHGICVHNLVLQYGQYRQFKPKLLPHYGQSGLHDQRYKPLNECVQCPSLGAPTWLKVRMKLVK